MRNVLRFALLAALAIAPAPALAQGLAGGLGPAGGGGGGGTVTSITNSDGTLTLSPNPIITTGTASLNLSHANTWTAQQVINLNSGAVPTTITGTALVLSPANSTTGRLQINGYAAISAVSLSRYDGTAAAPTAVVANDQIGGFNAYAYNGSALSGPIASFRIYATDNISSSAWGSEACIATAATTTTTVADSLCQFQSGGVNIGAPTGGDKGAGTLNIAGAFYMNGSLIGVVNAGTAGGVAYYATSSSNVSDGTSAAVKAGSVALGGCTIGADQLCTAGSATLSSATITNNLSAARVNVTGATVAANGIYLGGSNTLTFSTASTARWNIGSTGTFASTTSGGPVMNIGVASCASARFAPNGLNSTYGWSADSTPTKICGVVNGVEIFDALSSGISVAGSATFTGTIPTVTGTGTPTIATGSTDTAGEATSGTAATSVVVTFAGTHANSPFCTVTPQTQLAAFAYTLSTTAITITMTAATAEKIDYHCFQH